ncbi:hypothetical protein [Luteolibacter sp. Populi]|uniref:hypothetical protein n=1 Tax=Luteolibacter sp. Populi TaxID=3230487 RepID=UPI00346769F2
MAVAPFGWRHAVAGTGGAAHDAGLQWLLGRQSADGAWRSESYGAFRDGSALTPMVLRSLIGRREAATACRKAAAWMLEQGDALFAEYPVHHSSAILEAVGACSELRPLAELARKKLLALQCPRTGGWSYSRVAPPATGDLPPMQQANLSATAMAVDGLCAIGDPTAARKALEFVRVCQNLETGETTFDDGGFFQMPDDSARNKAGSAGADRNGKPRYLSYASATADGLRALLRCGEPADSPRVVTAASWLEGYRWSVQGSRNAPADLCYYTAGSLRHTSEVCARIRPVASQLLIAACGENGSWRNAAVEMREDCSVVATALAVEALG